MESPGGAADSEAAEAGSIPAKLSLRSLCDALMELYSMQSDARIKSGKYIAMRKNKESCMHVEI